MGSEQLQCQSNSLKSDSQSSSNSASKTNELEKMNCQPANKNTIIKRVWIIKRSITVNDDHVQVFNTLDLYSLFKRYNKNFEVSFFLPKQNIFKIKNESKWKFKHWATILELSNGSYINIQFGRNGFSVEEFARTNIEGENILKAILNTWGEESHPVSFCYLGEANYNYEILYNFLKKKKNMEEMKFMQEGNTYYNVIVYNCQHFCCEIELILFGYIQVWHSYPYYLNKFFKRFFPNININKLKMKYENDLKIYNEKLFKSNVNIIKDNLFVFKEFAERNGMCYTKGLKKIKKLEESFGLRIDDYLQNFN